MATTHLPKKPVRFSRLGTMDFKLTSKADDQCRLYRQYMNNGTGLWQHIILGNPSSIDYGYWATGNAWAAYGMLRVLVTMMHSEYREAMEAQKTDLKNWIVEILQASYPHTNVSMSDACLPQIFHRCCVLTFFHCYSDDYRTLTELSGRR